MWILTIFYSIKRVSLDFCPNLFLRASLFFYFDFDYGSEGLNQLFIRFLVWYSSWIIKLHVLTTSHLPYVYRIQRFPDRIKRTDEPETIKMMASVNKKYLLKMQIWFYCHENALCDLLKTSMIQEVPWNAWFWNW